MSSTASPPHPRKEEDASHHARRGRNADAFLNFHPETVLNVQSDLIFRVYSAMKVMRIGRGRRASLCTRISYFYLSGEDPRFCKRGIGQYPARLSGGFQSPTEINASGGSQPNAEAFLNTRYAQ